MSSVGTLARADEPGGAARGGFTSWLRGAGGTHGAGQGL